LPISWFALGLLAGALQVYAQEESLSPGINKNYEKPDVERIAKNYERESREVVKHLESIVKACGLKPGMDVADLGAGTGLFTRPFAKEVAPGGKVYAVDITPEFVKHIEETCRELGLKNVKTVVSRVTSTELPPDSVDLIFVCDTYHHFEYPLKMLKSIHEALRANGVLVIVDYKKEKGVSPEWIFGHVRADKKQATKEITLAGFRLIDEPHEMKENYMLRFEKVEGK
jgi:ubiquinone/menaquinone biosynthesis C-methylase UbiE